ncbi:MAG TPA: glycosyltransferase family 4 protein [Planctomycetota bacterium]|nr:glycosyltransferase family 4 protein [Planctomycetota bacterium]
MAGGAQENTVLSCQALLGRFDVHLVAGPPEGLEGSLVDDARRRGIRTTILPELVRPVRPTADLAALRRLAALFEAERPDLVHTHSSKAGILGRAAAWLARVPAVVHTNHGLPFYPGQPALVRAAWWSLEKLATAATDLVVCVGEEMRRQSIAARLGPPRMFEVVRSGIETERFLEAESCRPCLGIPDDRPVLGVVARLIGHKGHRFLIDAAPAGTHLLFVGGGELRDELERRARERGIPVTFTGHVPPEEVPDLIASMDVLVHPSLWEGLPRAAVQALLAGRPVVAFDCDGAREVVVDGLTGALVAPGSVEGLRRAIEGILARPDRGRSLGEEGRRRVREAFDWRSAGDRLASLYSTILVRRETSVV